jgi:hypothetical protein
MNAVGSHNASDISRIPVRKKPRIKANNYTGIGTIFFTDVVSHRLRYKAKISKSECIADDGAPAVGTKVDAH